MSNQNYKIFWQEALKQLNDEYKSIGKEDEFNIWFKLDYVEDESNVIKVNVPSEFMKEQIISRGYIEQIKNKLSQITGQTEFSIQMEITNSIISKLTVSKEEENSKVEKKSNEPAKKTEKENDSSKIKSEETSQKIFQHPQLMQKFTFNTFVPGDNNNYAYSASLAAAKNPGKSYNPILLYGGVGLGKTHLMQ